MKNQQKSNVHNYLYTKLTCFICILIILITEFSDLFAQPSGGPYGPIPQTYNLPKVTGKIYYVAVDGKTDASGESITQPASLESAIDRVVTGDAIIMRGGTYRTGNLKLNQGITIQPYADEQPVLKGTFEATDWKNLGNGLWTTKWAYLFPSKPAEWWQRDHQGKDTPQYRFNNDMLFIDGKFLQSVGWEGEVSENTYYIDYDAGLVYIGTNPENRLVEITAYNVALLRVKGECHGKTSDHKGPIIRGITFTQYAYRALEIEGTDPEAISPESEHGKDVVGTILENCTISFCSRVAAYLRGDKLIIRNCKISDTSTEGIYIIGSSDVLLEKNIFTRNNIERITGYFPAAVKIFNQCYRVTCRDNLVIDLPFSNGIWYDVGNVDGVFINNWVEGVGSVKGEVSKERPWPSDNGFFFEISKGAICAGNVFVNCDHGVWALNSSNVKFYQNTFINSTACIGHDGRNPAEDHFGWHSSTAPDVDKRDGHVFVNNLLTGDNDFIRPLLFVWQPSSLCDQLKNPQFIQLDYNIYVRSPEEFKVPLIIWSPAANDNCQIEYNTPANLQLVYPNFSVHSQYYEREIETVFNSVELKNFRLMQGVQKLGKASELPPEIKKLLNLQTKVLPYIGAYPASD